ncbi:hypothetical protein [Corallococcus llansteffanensis]|uniref:Uncharacterized protein n=1 Tax=Corallococcus llansteffanensis TaxID=2316731 RepID=A0A3A8P225_9BACT|nr:hypothetical protein [Corallococcus llansteffanensis]RKH50518.1 hypothetical protein D7V93_30455 [Corallococcus llansteffanensis]
MSFPIRPKAAPPAPPRAKAVAPRAHAAIKQPPDTKARAASAWEATGASGAAAQTQCFMGPPGRVGGGVVRGDVARGQGDSEAGAQMAAKKPWGPGGSVLETLEKVSSALKDLFAWLQKQARGSDSGATGSDSRSGQPTAQGNDPAVVAAGPVADGTQTAAITPALEKRISNGGNIGDSVSAPPGKDTDLVSEQDFRLDPKTLGEFLAEQGSPYPEHLLNGPTNHEKSEAHKPGANSSERSSGGPWTQDKNPRS